MNDWATLIVAAKKAAVDTVPKGWQTLQEIANDLKCHPVHARFQLNPLIGKSVERKKFRVELPAGGTRLIFHYRLKR